MVLYPILLSQSWSTLVPNVMLVSEIAQSGQNLALSRLAIGDVSVAQLVASMSCVVLGGVVMVVGSNLARGILFIYL